MATAPTRPAGLTPEQFRVWWNALTPAQRRAYMQQQTGLTAPQRTAQQRRDARAANRLAR